MKRKIVALLVSFLVAGSVGVYAKNNASAQTANTASRSTIPTSTYNGAGVSPQYQVVVGNPSSACPNSSVLKTTSSTPSSKAAAVSPVYKTASSCPNTAANTVSASPSCSQNSACAGNTVCANSQQNCAQNACLKNGTICTVQLNCSNGSCSSYNDYVNALLKSMTNGSCSQPTSSSVKTPSTPGKASSTPSKAPSTPSKAPSSSSSNSGTTSSKAPSASSGSSYSSFQNQVLTLVNQQRAANGLKALSMDSALTKTATLKSQDMAKLGYFDHTSPTYGSPFDMMKQFGITYRAAGENIAMGQTSPQQVMQDWMNSPGHRANILNSSFTKLGVGIAQNSSGQYYWTQQFIG
jgi:uncharacterized YkwD family protein